MLITVTDEPSPRRGHPKLPAPQAPTLQSTGSGARRRLRILRLQRPASESYGFHLRGGKEHGTGFFISHVEPSTEAYAQGLRTGDQVLRVNDLNVSGALHKEVASLVRAGDEVILHVKSTGLIPVKNHAEDPLSWVLVDPTNDLADHSNVEELPECNNYSSSLSSSTGSQFSVPRSGAALQIIVSGAAKQTLGCSICKGPPEKPGIFVRRVSERGIAEEAGLRPGDQLLSCNGISFLNTDFQQAVQAMKASPYLQLEVLRGVGMELVAGESSGYNSSASSEMGEEHYTPSEIDFKDSFASPSLTSTLTRLNGARDRIQLDAGRDWTEIEAEWEDAEMSEKRSQLKTSHTLLSQKINSTKLNKSLLNLTINEMETEPISRKSAPRQPPPGACNTCSHLAPPSTLLQNRRSGLTKPRSMTDLRVSEAGSPSNFRIAMQMTPNEHVSKIVIPSAPKDEQSALLRLEELSSGGSKNSTLLPTKNAATNHSKTCSISSTSSEESATYRLFPDCSRPDFGPSLKEHRQLLRCKSVPQNCSTPLSSEDSDSLLSFPSSTITLHKSGSGRFTSKIQIRSSPPPPPPRGNATTLTRQHRKLKCVHHRKWDNIPIHRHGTLSPPGSPCTSTTSSGDTHHLGPMGSTFRRRQSLESLSASSEESVHWEDLEKRSRIITPTAVSSHHTRAASGIVPPPPPPPPPSQAPLSSAIPPPPPPPLQVPSNDRSPFCSQIINRQQEITSGAVKLRSKEHSSNPNLKKAPPPDPKKAQHEKLMEEFKRAHALMVAKREAANSTESTMC